MPTLRLWPATLLALALAAWTGLAWAEASEAELKAAFVFNFAKFVDWPAEALNGSDLSLCLVGGRDGLFEALADKDGKPVKGRTLRVRSLGRADNLKACQILVMAESEAAHFETVLRRLEGVPVLTVNGSERFLDAGGMIGLATEGNKVRFDINLASARRNGLALSSNLLKLARTVRQ